MREYTEISIPTQTYTIPNDMALKYLKDLFRNK